MSVKDSLVNALKKLGRVGATSIGSNASDVDIVLHQFLVDTTSKSFFERQLKEGHKKLDAIIESQAEATKARELILASTRKNKSGGSTMLIAAEQYALLFSTRAPVVQLDKEKLRVLLTSKYGLSLAQVDEAYSAASKTNQPAQIYTVVPRNELLKPEDS